ncbi:small lysine-rich protein 1 [Takifugu rubripes]|nr:small lysine-rich protein 1 [Takifugu rubripes]|eukprot:XP_011611799.1 PREDICTED: small lysine-rich protein 1 [Takifugu rubripes]
MRLFRCHSPQCQVLMDHFSPRFIMPTKPRKSTPHSSKPAKKPRDAKAPKKGPSGAKSAPKEVDIFSPAAMENLYYISHNAVDCLTFRGFGWSQAKSKKKKKGSKPKKKK